MHARVRVQASTSQRAAVMAYVEAASRKSDLERSELQKDKSGVFTGKQQQQGGQAPAGREVLLFACSGCERGSQPVRGTAAALAFQ